MIWLTWRRHRGEAFAAGIAFVLLSPIILHISLTGAVDLRVVGFQQYQSDTITPLIIVFSLILPALVGMFIGVPLVIREIEQGTQWLIWTQSITRQHWLRVKLSLLTVCIVVLSALLTLALTWWSTVVSAQSGPWWTYDVQGTVLIAYTLFAFLLGVTVGVYMRRMLPAMVVTLLIFLGFRWLVEIVLRPIFLPALESTWNFGGANPFGRDWFLGGTIIDAQGKSIATAMGNGNWISTGYNYGSAPLCADVQKNDFTGCLHIHGAHLLAFYHAADQFALFQGIETSILLALSVGLSMLTLHWIKKRAS